MNTEDILKQCKMPEASSDLKARIAGATRGEWEKIDNKSTAEFPREMWRLVLALAASVLIVVAGNVTNSLITGQASDDSQGPTACVDNTKDTIKDDDEIAIGASAKLSSFVRSEQPVDISSITRMRETIDKEFKDENAQSDRAEEKVP